MGPGITLFLAFPVCLGFLILTIGAIIRLCEMQWEKRPGEMGSRRFFQAAAILILPPILIVIAIAIWMH